MADLPVLSPLDARILGSLLEKEVTVPASYPLTLNGLRSACNQSSSRDPVTDYDDRTLEQAARDLKDRGLLRIVWAPKGPRTLKYHQTLSEELAMAADERAVLTVLLLRGPQTPGELRTRCERLFAFADRAAVEETLRRLADRQLPLVAELERRPGQHDRRWMHLLGDAEVAAAGLHDQGRGQQAQSAGSGGPAHRESVLAAGPAARDDKVRAAWATVAEAYLDDAVRELDDQPFESWLLRRTVELAGPHPVVVEVGCGPGHVTDFLARAGAEATGVDFTPQMIEQARTRFPGGTYRVGDLHALTRPDNAAGWGAVLAWYSLIHLAPSELPTAVAALVRPLRPGGWLVVALHAGTGLRHVAEAYGKPIDVDLVLHTPDEVRTVLDGAGLVDVEWYLRGPMTARGESTERAYLLGRRPE